MEKDRLGTLSSIIGTFSFMVFGVVGYMNLKSPMNKTNIIFGVLVGLLFGFVSKKIFAVILNILNGDIREKHTKGIISSTVSRSTVFMFPFATMALLSAHFLGWQSVGVFYSSAIMSTGVMASTEIAKLKEKVAIRNMIATSVSAFLLSYLWMFSAGYLKNVPGILESIIRVLLPLIGVKIG